MKRSNFLKSLATFIAAPSLIEKVAAKEVVKDVLPAYGIKEYTFQGFDTITIPVKDVRRFHVGDIVRSDLNDKAIITAILPFGDTIIIRPVIKGKYEYMDKSRIESYSIQLPPHKF